MLCKGHFGSKYTIAGSHTHKTYIYTDGVEYKGTLETRSLLATTQNYTVTAENVILTHVKVTNNNNYRYCVDISALGSYARYCYLEDNSTSSNYGAVSLYGSNDGAVYNCDIKSTASQIVKIGYGKPALVVSCTAFGATVTSINNTPNSTNQITKNNFFFGNGADFGTKPENFSDNASQDLTGNVTGYDESHCVNFAGGDYRIKIGSPLHGVSGAFFETASLTENHSSAITINTNATLSTKGKKSASGGFSIMSLIGINVSGIKSTNGKVNLSPATLVNTKGIKTINQCFAITPNCTIDAQGKKSAFGKVRVNNVTSFTLSGTAANIIAHSGGFSIIANIGINVSGRKSISTNLGIANQTIFTHKGKKSVVAGLSLSALANISMLGKKSATAGFSITNATYINLLGYNHFVEPITRTISINGYLVSMQIACNINNTITIQGAL